MSFSEKNGWVQRGFQVTAMLNSLAVLFILSIYAYGGFFSRYVADDYCEAVDLYQAKNVLDATIQAYKAWMNSYSLMLFVQFSEWGGIWGFRLMAGVTILLWVIGLVWLVSEIGKALGLPLSFAVKLWIAGLAIFLSLYQTPVLFQILYWRTGMIPYTLPLVFFVGIAAFVLWYAQLPFQRSRARWAGILCVGLVFFASGLGETTAALQIGLLVVVVLTVSLTRTEHQRKDVLTMLTASLIFAVISMLIIAFSPGTATRLDIIMRQAPVYNPIELASDVIAITSHFLWDTLKVAPLPNLIAIAVPFGILYFHASSGNLSPAARIRLAILAVLLFTFIVVGFSFAPSAFVRTYPAARARFAAQFVVTLSLILEGGLLGILASRLYLPGKTDILRGLTVGLLGLLIVYPLYTASKISNSMVEYQKFAIAWDERDAYIKKSVAEGVKDLVVVQLDSVGGVGEYKGNKSFWINSCAARYYGLDSLIAP
jgi:hypothetical protein